MRKIEFTEDLLNQIDTEKNSRYVSGLNIKFREMDISNLMKSISEGWNIDSQIYIRKYNDKEKYYVVEGNRRVSALKKYYDNQYKLEYNEEIDHSILKLQNKEDIVEKLSQITVYELNNDKEEEEIIEKYHYSDELKKKHNTLNNRFHTQQKYFRDNKNMYKESEFMELALFYYFDSNIEDVNKDLYQKYVEKPTPIPRTLFQNKVNGKKNYISKLFNINKDITNKKFEITIGNDGELFLRLFIFLLEKYCKNEWINNQATTIDDFYEELDQDLKEYIYKEKYFNHKYKSSSKKLDAAKKNYDKTKSLLLEVKENIVERNENYLKEENQTDDVKELILINCSLLMILDEYSTIYESRKKLIDNPIIAHILCRTCIECFGFNYYITGKIKNDKLVNKKENQLKKTMSQYYNGRIPTYVSSVYKAFKEENEETENKTLTENFLIYELKNNLGNGNYRKLNSFVHYPQKSVDIVDQIPKIINSNLQLYKYYYIDN